MKRILVLAAWLAITPLAFAVETETFRSSAPAGALVRYSVTVSAAPGDDVDSIAAQLAATYGVKLEPADDGAPKRFALIASEARARLLSTDPRVAMVEDWSAPSRVAAASVPGLGDYTYDGAGNITKVGSRTYVYDSVGRLASVSKNGSDEQEYSYDRYGNLLTITTTTVTASNDVVVETARLGANAANNRIDQNVTGGIPNGIVATYDSFGNIVWSPTGTFAYDQFNMPKESTVGGVRSLYLYSASDERVATIQPSLSKELWTLRDSGGRVLRRMERKGTTWSWSQDYVYGAGRLIASAVPTEAKVLHYHLDHLGTPRLITGNGGAQIGQHDYYPFGLELAGSTNDGERLKFTGHERDAATLDYMHARYYDGLMGRFLSVDPKASWRLAAPQSWNRYSYAVNNPLKYVDPDGREIKIAVSRQNDIVDVRVRLTVEIYSADGPRPRASTYRQDLQGAANILSGVFGGEGRSTMRVTTTIDAIFTENGGTDPSRHQLTFDRHAGLFTGHADVAEQGGNEASMGVVSDKWFAHEFAHWLGLPDNAAATEEQYDENLMNNDDPFTRQMTREQWLEIMRAYREGELNQGIEPRQ